MAFKCNLHYCIRKCKLVYTFIYDSLAHYFNDVIVSYMLIQLFLNEVLIIAVVYHGFVYFDD